MIKKLFLLNRKTKMENLSNLSNEELTKKFQDSRLAFQQSLEDQSLRDSLNEQLGILAVECKRRDLDPDV
jgi:hypothetical protein